MAGNNAHKIIVNASTECLAKVRQFVMVHSIKFGFNEDQVSDIRLAVDEACTNIIKHAYKYDINKKVEINVTLKGEKLCITLKDTGDAFNPAGYSKPNLREHIKNRRKGGVGVFLIQELMDKVEYLEQKGFNIIRMYKYRV